jgi:hypothetical protein
MLKPLTLTLTSALALALAAPAAAKILPGKGGAKNVRVVGHHDLAARTAYQPTIRKQGDRWIAYVGHHGGRMVNPLTGKEEENGTSILDVTDPKKPKLLHHIPGELGRVVPGRETGGAQMTRVCDGATLPKGDKSKVYLLRTFGEAANETWDVTNPEKPVRLAVIPGFRSTHKNEWECDTGVAYLPGSGDDKVWRASRVTHIYDLSDPANPKKIREFALTEQKADQTGYNPGQIHGPISTGPQGNRVFFGYGTNARGVGQIVDRKKLLEGSAEPTPENLRYPEVGRIMLPDFMGAHTTFPLYDVEVPNFRADTKGRKRNFVVVVNENNVTVCAEHRQMVVFFDVTDEARPMGVSTYDVKETDDDFCKHGGRFGAHASHENTTPIFHKRLMFFSWFNAGMRVVDVRDPYNPKEVGYFIAPVTKLTDKRCADEVKNTDCKIAIQTNNMEVDDRGYIYVVDRANTGMHIVELTGAARAIANYPKTSRVAGKR